ncbi:MAG: GNAT family N-acetyltransferase [Cyanobacteria bacterium P01_F01_bin.86]
MTYTFRKVGVESAEALAHLAAATFMQAYSDVHSPENIRAYCVQNYSLEAAIATLSSDQFACTIADRENVSVGYYTLKYQQCPTPLGGSSCELKQIYILSSEYGAGLGRRLFEHACEVARETGAAWLWLCVSDRNYRAKKFYQKLNFEPVTSGPILMVGTDQLPSTIMALCIGAS